MNFIGAIWTFMIETGLQGIMEAACGGVVKMLPEKSSLKT